MGFGFSTSAFAQPFQLPTANRTLFNQGGGEKFFVGTTGRTWESGTFGCVRSEGWQMHEGLDIRSVQRDRRGEPLDPVLASADGTVAYMNTRASASNYGKYAVLRHTIDGLEVFTVYAHLSALAGGLKTGQGVKAGQVIGSQYHHIGGEAAIGLLLALVAVNAAGILAVTSFQGDVRGVAAVQLVSLAAAALMMGWPRR